LPLTLLVLGVHFSVELVVDHLVDSVLEELGVLFLLLLLMSCSKLGYFLIEILIPFVHMLV